MQITRTSMITNITRTVELDITQKQLDDYKNGVLLQDAFPNLSPNEREFIKSGIVPIEWESFIDEVRPEQNEYTFTYPTKKQLTRDYKSTPILLNG